MTVFVLFFGFLKISDCMVNVFEESKLSKDPKQLANIHSY